MSLFRTSIYIMALMTIFLGVRLHEIDIEDDTQRNIYNYTESTFDTWNSSQWQQQDLNYTNITMEEAFTFRVKNMIFKAVDLFGYSLIQGIKLGIEFGYEKAYNYDPESFLSLGKLVLVIIIIISITPIIVPVLALFYLLFEGFKWIINKWKGK